MINQGDREDLLTNVRAFMTSTLDVMDVRDKLGSFAIEPTEALTEACEGELDFRLDALARALCAYLGIELTTQKKRRA